jgi:hypothetical protein
MDTGFKVAATEISDNWTTIMSPATIGTSDNTRAIATSTSFLAAVMEDFTFGLPAGVTIDGIEVLGEFSSSVASDSAALRLSLSWNNGTNFTATKLDTNDSTTDANKTYGGATDTWGRSWTTAELADGTFQIKIEGRNVVAGSSCRLDYLAIKIYYTPSSFLIMF